jgi:hypothetical protein
VLALLKKKERRGDPFVSITRSSRVEGLNVTFSSKHTTPLNRFPVMIYEIYKSGEVSKE